MKYLPETIPIPDDARKDFPGYDRLRIGFEVLEEQSGDSANLRGHIDFHLIPDGNSGEKEVRAIRMATWFGHDPGKFAQETLHTVRHELLVKKILYNYQKYGSNIPR